MTDINTREEQVDPDGRLEHEMTTERCVCGHPRSWHWGDDIGCLWRKPPIPIERVCSVEDVFCACKMFRQEQRSLSR